MVRASPEHMQQFCRTELQELLHGGVKEARTRAQYAAKVFKPRQSDEAIRPFLDSLYLPPPSVLLPNDATIVFR